MMFKQEPDLMVVFLQQNDPLEVDQIQKFPQSDLGCLAIVNRFRLRSVGIRSQQLRRSHPSR